jgi:uncharacterized protein (DUF433 family)
MNPPVTHIKVEDGIARTINKNVKVKMIASKYLDAGASVDEIAEHYGITQADVFAALTYFCDNLDDFEEQTRRNQALLAQHGVSSTEVLGKMRAKARELKGE